MLAVEGAVGPAAAVVPDYGWEGRAGGGVLARGCGFVDAEGEGFGGGSTGGGDGYVCGGLVVVRSWWLFLGGGWCGGRVAEVVGGEGCWNG